jgi:hypothetical protein
MTYMSFLDNNRIYWQKDGILPKLFWERPGAPGSPLKGSGVFGLGFLVNPERSDSDVGYVPSVAGR